MDCYRRRNRTYCVRGYCNYWSCDMVDAQEKELQKGNKTVRIKVNLPRIE